MAKIYVIHENDAWVEPLRAAFTELRLPFEEWFLSEGLLDLAAVPPSGVFYNRMSASSHTRGHPYAKELARGVLCWLEAHGRVVVNGRRVLELEVSKVDQLTALAAAGFDVPATIAVAGRDGLAAAARRMPAPFITKHNQGGKGLGVRLWSSHEELEAALAGPGWEDPVDGITLVQEYLRAAAPFITRAEFVGGEFRYALTADTARGGFELCPADACAVVPGAGPGAVLPGGGGAVPDPAAPSLFALRDGFDHPVIGRYRDFAAAHGIGIAGFEFIETADGRLVTYDVNTTTNYNAGVEAVAPRPALPAVARYLGGLLEQVRSADQAA